MKALRRLIASILEAVYKKKRVVLALSCFVVFVTTYVLILPAFTLEKDEAARQGGIDLPSVETTAESDSADDVPAASDEADMSAADGDIQNAGDAYSSGETLTNEDANIEDDEADMSADGDTEYPDDADAQDKNTDNADQNSDDADAEDENASTDSDATAIASSDAVLEAAAAEPQVEAEAAADLDAQDEEPEAQTADPLTFEGNGFTVSVDDTHSVLPGDTQLAVEELIENPTEGTKAERREQMEAYKVYCDQAIAAINEESKSKATKTISFAKLYDISLQSSGEEISPDKPVDVTISYDKKTRKDLKVDEAADVRIIHFAQDEKTEEVTAELIDEDAVDVTLEKSMMAETTFEAESFSVYAVIYTVDFHYAFGGQTYEVSIPGGGYMSLTHIIEVLGIAHTEGTDSEPASAAKEFVADVANVEFSTPELLSVSRIDENTTVGAIRDDLGLECEYSAELTEEQIAEINAQKADAGDWALISLKPFDTEEILTVTMKNGDQLEIRVTDASYSTTQVRDLDGKSVALVNLRNNNAMESTTHRGTGHLNAVDITYNASTNTISTTDPYVVLSKWTFEKVTGTDDRYYISSPNGYLNINGGTLAVTPNRQALQVQQKADGTIRIKHPNNNYAVNNDNNSTANGYTTWQYGGNDNQGEWFTAFELGAGPGMIALNPMNENGVLGWTNHTSTSYKNMKIDGVTVDNNHLQNSRMYIPVNYNDNGTAEVTLPSHNQLGGFSVSAADPATHSIAQAEDKYQWILKGWVNIATGEYYDVSAGPATATVNQDDLNVFYADWWAEEYDYTYDEYIDTADTSGFATIKMWDYNELFNLTSSEAWSVDHDANQFIPRTTLESEEWYITQVNGHQGDYFQFVDNTDSSNAWQYGTLGNQQGRNGGNEWSNYSYYGTLNIIGRQGQVPNTGVLESLFSETNVPGSGVNYLGEGNYLFSYNENTKVYSYDSAQNGAVYNQSEGRFYVGQEPRQHIRGGGVAGLGPGFLPLNDTESDLAFNNGTINYWLGMSIDVDFWLPDTPGSSANANLVAGQHMRFDFTGDDDVWVLIDGKLALDIGGIHEAVGGYIDFTTGQIRNAKGNTYNLSNMGIGAGAHTLSFYYLERGGNASNCKITFNIAPRWVEEPVQRGVASVTKTWSDDTPAAAKQDLTFSLMTGDGTPVEGSSVGYDDGTEEDGVWSYVWSGLDPSQDYQVVEGADPRFNQTSSHETQEIADVWAAAIYDQENAFGSSTIILGNGLRSAQGGRLLNGDGSTSAADIDNDIVKSEVSDAAKWTVEGYDTEDQHFYLKNSSGRYLSIRNGRVQLVNDTSTASWFYMSPSGDLNDAYSDYRLRTDSSNGAISVGRIVNSADETDTDSPDRIHVYTYHDIYAKTVSYNVLNTYVTSLQMKKQVTINDFDPDNSAVTDKTVADGTYIINVEGKDGTATAGKSYTVMITVTDGTASSATIRDNTAAESADTPAALVDGVLEIPDMIPGEYTVTEEEDTKTVLSAINSTDSGSVTDLDNRSLTITLEGSAATAQLITLTNNFAENSETDIAHVSARKTFAGIKPGMALPENFHMNVKVTATIDGSQQVFNYILTGATDTANGVLWNQSVNADGDIVWDWKIAIRGLTPDAQVEIEEVNYSKTGYDVTPSADPGGDNVTSYTGTVSSSTVVQSQAVVTTKQNQLIFPLTDEGNTATIFVARIVPSQTALVISKNRLNLSEKAALEAQLRDMPNANDWYRDTVPLYYSFEDAANHKITVRNSSEVTYSETTPGDPSTGQIEFDKKCQWNMVALITQTYVEGRPADFNFVNTYTETGVDLDIVKLDATDMSTPLDKAQFVLTKLDPDDRGAYLTGDGAEERTSDETDAEGRTVFTGITTGYYEISEVKMPAGYVKIDDGKFYIKVYDGVISRIIVTENDPETTDIDESLVKNWTVVGDNTDGALRFSSAMAAIEDDPDTPEDESQDAVNAIFAVGNTPGVALPHTGGIGTVFFYILGSMLVMGCSVLLISRRWAK